MKRKFLATAARSGLSIILVAHSAIAYCAEDGFAKWATTHALPITTVESASNDSDLLPLEYAIGTARIVALGEPMHGAHEPLEFRNRLFRFLVERKGFTAIALESGFTESLGARSFVEDGEGDAETTVQKGLPPLPENRELIQWMRDYNAAAASAGHHKVRLYGIDMTAGGRKNGPWLTIDCALTYLSLADPTAAQNIRQSLGDTLSGIDAREFGSLPPAAQTAFETSIQTITQATQKSRKSLIKHSSEDQYHWALHNLEAARQLARCLPITPQPQASHSLWVHATECRDARMAANVQWAVENEGQRGRLLVFAHDGHVMAAKEDGRRLADVPYKPAVMGFNLRLEYGKDLYIILLVCKTTSGGLLTAKPLEEGSIESTLAGVNLPLIFLDIRKAQRDKDALAWLSTRRSYDANVTSQELLSLQTAMDAFVFVNTLTPARASSGETP